MPVIAIINRKGGSGKSTLAAHLAAWFAHEGKRVMLGDVDRQQSTRAWLHRRNPLLPAIASWSVDQSNILRAPRGISHVVLDTPGGLHGLELAKVVMQADAILIPVCNSTFDRESAAACYAELQTLPRVTNGRCQVAAIGMRIDSRTRGTEVLEEWAASIDLPFLGVLRETQLYVQCLEHGLTLFDLSSSRSAKDIPQWQPLLDWLDAAVASPPATSTSMPAQPAVPTIAGSALPDTLQPAQKTMFPGSRLIHHPMATAGARPHVPPLLRTASPSGELS